MSLEKPKGFESKMTGSGSTHEPVIVRQGRMQPAAFLVAFAGAAAWGASGLTVHGSRLVLSYVILCVCGLAAAGCIYSLLRPSTMLEMRDQGLRVADVGEVPWASLSSLEVYLPKPQTPASRVMQALTKWNHRIRNSSRVLRVVGAAQPLNGPKADADRHTIALIVQFRVEAELETVIAEIKRFAPSVRVEYGPGARSPSRTNWSDGRESAS